MLKTKEINIDALQKKGWTHITSEVLLQTWKALQQHMLISRIRLIAQLARNSSLDISVGTSQLTVIPQPEIETLHPVDEQLDSTSVSSNESSEDSEGEDVKDSQHTGVATETSHDQNATTANMPFPTQPTITQSQLEQFVVDIKDNMETMMLYMLSIGIVPYFIVWDEAEYTYTVRFPRHGYISLLARCDILDTKVKIILEADHKHYEVSNAHYFLSPQFDQRVDGCVHCPVQSLLDELRKFDEELTLLRTNRRLRAFPVLIKEHQTKTKKQNVIPPEHAPLDISLDTTRVQPVVTVRDPAFTAEGQPDVDKWDEAASVYADIASNKQYMQHKLQCASEGGDHCASWVSERERLLVSSIRNVPVDTTIHTINVDNVQINDSEIYRRVENALVEFFGCTISTLEMTGLRTSGIGNETLLDNRRQILLYHVANIENCVRCIAVDLAITAKNEGWWYMTLALEHEKQMRIHIGVEERLEYGIHPDKLDTSNPNKPQTKQNGASMDGIVLPTKRKRED